MITVLSEQWDRLSSSDPNRLSKEIIEYVGLSTDEKPTDLIVTGSTFLEADTGNLYIFSEEGAEWIKLFSLKAESGE